MSVIHMTQQLKGKPVISIANGNVLAWLQDVLVAPNMHQLAAAVTYGSDGLNLQDGAIPGHKIRVWGRDALLTDRSSIAKLLDGSRELAK
jgi:sporulation protein YlmC with PRC-barrel domain